MEALRSIQYLNSPLELLVFSQKSFGFNQWCPQFGAGIEHSLAIPNPADNLPKKTELITNIYENEWTSDVPSSVLVAIPKQADNLPKKTELITNTYEDE